MVREYFWKDNLMEDIEITRKITMSTIRLITETSTGTEFFCNFYLDDGKFIPTIITNKTNVCLIS